jgi:hypothetical protein
MTFLVIRIKKIRMFLGLPDPHPDLLGRGTTPRIRIRIGIRTEMSRIHSTALPLCNDNCNMQDTFRYLGERYFILLQGCGSGPAWIHINMQKWPTKLEKIKNFPVLKCFMFFLRAEGEGFSCSLGVHYRGLGISKLQIFIKKIKYKISAVIFLQFWSSKP